MGTNKKKEQRVCVHNTFLMYLQKLLPETTVLSVFENVESFVGKFPKIIVSFKRQRCGSKYRGSFKTTFSNTKLHFQRQKNVVDFF